MPTIAIVGAGPGLGLSIAQRFGREGFRVALVSRTRDKLDALVAQLAARGVDAAGFVGDVLDRGSLAGAFAQIKTDLGQIDVLEYSPAPRDSAALAPVDALSVTVENVQPQVEYYVYGALTAVAQVLPDMVARGSGTLLFTTGGSSANVYPAFGNIAIASSALRNWVLNLHAALADKGVYAAHVPLSTWIGHGGPETQPDTIAEVYWDIYTKRDEAEHPYSTL